MYIMVQTNLKLQTKCHLLLQLYIKIMSFSSSTTEFAVFGRGIYCSSPWTGLIIYTDLKQKDGGWTRGSRKLV